jgi:hypothetical protein
MSPRRLVTPGERFRHLVYISEAPSHDRRRRCLFLCDCGKQKVATLGDVHDGNTTSCGHAKNPLRHGHALQGKHSREYQAWANMKARCLNPTNKAYGYYGGRGITVCEEWNSSFERFLGDVGPRPGPAHSIDRIDNDRGYAPGNVVWATKAKQQQNTRGVRLNAEAVKVIRFFVLRGKSYALLARIYGTDQKTVRGAALGRTWRQL